MGLLIAAIFGATIGFILGSFLKIASKSDNDKDT